MKIWYTGLVMCLTLGVGTQMRAQEEATYKILYDVRSIKVGEVSNNGEWIGCGSIDGIAYYYNTETEKAKMIIDKEHPWIAINAISNSGMLLGSYGVNSMAPATYYKDNKWTKLPVPQERINQDSGASAISDDETIIGGYVDGPITVEDVSIWPCIWRLVDGKYQFEQLPQPDKDITGERPQGSMVRDMSADGSVIVGEYRNKDGFKQFPMWWKRGEDGKYTYTIWGEDMLYDLNALNPGIYPDFSEYVTAEKGTPEYEEQYVAWGKLLNDYNNKRAAFYSGKGSFQLRNIAVSGNGRWMVIGWHEKDNPKKLQAYRIDLQNNTAITLEGNRNTCPRMVLDDGTVIAFSGFNEVILTGQVYKDERSGQIPLYEWIKEEKGVDISEDFLFNIPIIDSLTGETVNRVDSIVTGCCTISKDGSTVISFLSEPDNYSHIINYYVRKKSASNVSSPLSQDIMIYANENILYIQGEVKEISLFDISGKSVYHANTVADSLPLEFLQKGIYLVRLLTLSGEVVTDKILVE